jgi:hypothetical protein
VFGTGPGIASPTPPSSSDPELPEASSPGAEPLELLEPPVLLELPLLLVPPDPLPLDDWPPELLPF